MCGIQIRIRAVWWRSKVPKVSEKHQLKTIGTLPSALFLLASNLLRLKLGEMRERLLLEREEGGLELLPEVHPQAFNGAHHVLVLRAKLCLKAPTSLLDRVLKVKRKAFSLPQTSQTMLPNCDVAYNARLEIDVVGVHCGLELLHVDFEVLFSIFDLVCSLGLGREVVRWSNLSRYQ